MGNRQGTRAAQAAPSVSEGVPNPPRRQARRAQLGRSGSVTGGVGNATPQAGRTAAFAAWPEVTNGEAVALPAPWHTWQSAWLAAGPFELSWSACDSWCSWAWCPTCIAVGLSSCAQYGAAAAQADCSGSRMSRKMANQRRIGVRIVGESIISPVSCGQRRAPFGGRQRWARA